jgi:hypothetical protein
MSEPILTSAKVMNLFSDCLFKPGEDTSKAVKVEGVIHTFGLHPERVARYKEEIIKMLSQLPDPFRQSAGGGWSFLNACNDRHGNQWIGLHQTMEQLFVLGIAIGRVESCMPRDMWDILPGGMPYYVIKGM